MTMCICQTNLYLLYSIPCILIYVNGNRSLCHNSSSVYFMFLGLCEKFPQALMFKYYHISIVIYIHVNVYKNVILFLVLNIFKILYIYVEGPKAVELSLIVFTLMNRRYYFYHYYYQCIWPQSLSHPLP